jgi:uncharacterized phage-associated protein
MAHNTCTMSSVHDVAQYIVQRLKPISAMRLQKLVYYAQAWSLVWEEKPLFRATIEAWANGPVVPVLYNVHRGQFIISSWPFGDTVNLDQKQKKTIDAVIRFYGRKTAQALSDLTHREKPWREARRGLSEGDRGSNEISLASIHEYYSSLPK